MECPDGPFPVMRALDKALLGPRRPVNGALLGPWRPVGGVPGRGPSSDGVPRQGPPGPVEVR